MGVLPTGNMRPVSVWVMAILLGVLAALVISPMEASRTSRHDHLLNQLLSDDEMPYDMSAVEEMEKAHERHAAMKAASEATAFTVHQEVAPVLPHSLNHHTDTGMVELHDVLGQKQDSMFSEKDVESFLEQRAHARAQLEAKAKLRAQARAEAEARAKAEAEARAKAEAKAKAKAAAKAKAEAEARARAEVVARAAAEARTKFEAEAKAKAAAKAEAEAREEQEIAEHAVALFEAELDGDAALRDEALNKLRAKSNPKQEALVETQSKAATQAQQKQKQQQAQKQQAKKPAGPPKPWWTSREGVESNYHRYVKGVKNSMVSGVGSVKTSGNSYSLPLGKQGHSLLESKSKMKSKVKHVPIAVPSYATVPVPSNGFEPILPVPVVTPKKLPQYMAESQQPWAGAGYYGSGGGQGPIPGSEAFVPLPGVDGKEFGIRAREAWERHAAEYGNNPDAFYDPTRQPDYPYFPSWSRESEIGGRPDIFPRPMHNMRRVNRFAQRIGQRFMKHSQRFYPHLNRPVAPLPVTGRGAIPVVQRAVGYQVHTPTPLVGFGSPVPVPETFPQPLDSHSFNDNVNYMPLVGATAQPMMVAPSTIAPGTLALSSGFPQMVAMPPETEDGEYEE